MISQDSARALNITQRSYISWRSVLVGVLGAALYLGLIIVPAEMGRAATTPVPPGGVELPAALDWLPEYHGQTLCSPTPKPGTLKLGALLDATYGQYTKYFTGSPCPNGLEHQEGRALDWMVNSEKPAQNAKAEAFIAWLLAKGPNGEPGANARRLGILYLVWNDKIWGVYRQQDEWREYSSCSSKAKQVDSYDTSCHRDHIHFSMTWDGANAQTSFWSGQAEIRPPCPSSSRTRSGGSASAPVTLLNTHSGVGLSAKNCRLAGHTRYSGRSYKVRVPVPKVANGKTPMQRIRVEKFALNAPTSLKISSAEAVYVPQGAKLPLTLDLPLREDGAITMSLAAGHARVKLKALGVSESIPTVSATLNKKRSWTKNRITASGKVSFAPSGASVVLQRKINGVWADKASAAARHGSYSLSTRAGTVTGRIAHRVILRKKDAVVAASPGLSLKVRTIGFHHFWVKNPVIRKTWTRVKATIADVPGRATIFVRRKTPGDKWRTAYRGRVSDGRFKKRVSVTKRGSYLLKMKIKSAKGVRIVRSPVLAVKVN